MKILLTLVILMFSGSAFAQTYNCSYNTVKDVSVSVVSTSYLSKNAARRCLVLENKDSSINVYVRVGSAHNGTEGILLRANTRWEAIVPAIGAVYLKSASGLPVVSISEGE